LKELKAVGIKTSALICPVIPYITDVHPLIDMLCPHTEKIWIYRVSILNRSDNNWQNIKSILENHFNESKEQIEAAVFSKDHFLWENLRHELLEIQKDRQLNLRIHV
jgi:DNA repair photolyase